MRSTSLPLVPLLGLAVTLALAGAAREAGAATSPKTSALSWVRMPGAESCMSARELAQGVERRLGRSVFVSAALGDLSIEGRIERAASPPGYQAHLTLTSSDGGTLGTRELRGDGDDCRALDEQLVLVVAVMIDPDAALRPPPHDEPVAPPAPVPAPSPAPPVPAAREEKTPPPARPWQGGALAGASVGFGLLPNVVAGVDLRGHLASPWRWSADLGATVWIPTQIAGGTHVVTFSLAYAFLALCPPGLDTAIVRLRGCAGVQVGAIRGSGAGYNLDQATERPVVDVALEARVSRRLYGPLLGEIGLGLVVPALRDEFVSQTTTGGKSTTTPIFQMSAVAGTVGAGLGFELP
jgi:hypothetical protein